MPYGTQELKIIGYAKPKSFEITSGKMIVTDRSRKSTKIYKFEF